VGHFLHLESEEVFDVYRELLSNTVSTIDDYLDVRVKGYTK
jgi:hypothetical protein